MKQIDQDTTRGMEFSRRYCDEFPSGFFESMIVLPACLVALLGEAIADLKRRIDDMKVPKQRGI